LKEKVQDDGGEITY